MRKILILGAVAAVLVAFGVSGAGKGILQSAGFIASGTGATERTGMAKLRDTVSVKDYGATGDGTTDDAVALQAAITAGAAVGGSVLFPVGTYLTTAMLTVPSNSRIVGYGAKIKFSNTAANDTVFSLSSVSKVSISGLEIDGQKASVATSTEFKHGISVMSSTDITIRDVYSHDNKGDGLYFGAADLAAANARVYVENYRSDANYRNAVTITNLNGGRFVGVRGTATVGTSPQAGLDIEPNYDGDTVSNVEFVGCELSGNTGAGAQVILRQAPTGVQRGIRFTNCAFNGNTTQGLLMYHGVQVDFVNSDFTLNTSEGVLIDRNTTDISFVGSTIRKNGARGVNLVIAGTYTAKRIKFVDCRILDNSQTSANTLDGIRTGGVLTGLTLIGNDLSNDAGVTQRYGLTTADTSTTNLRMFGNTAVSNATGAYILGDDPTTRHAAGNIGLPNVPNGGRKVITYSASMTPSATDAGEQFISATNGTAFTINAPAGAASGVDLLFRIKNTSGGALGVATWDVIYKMPAWVQPATGFARWVQFRYDGTNWVETFRSTADVPN